MARVVFIGEVDRRDLCGKGLRYGGGLSDDNQGEEGVGTCPVLNDLRRPKFSFSSN